MWYIKYIVPYQRRHVFLKLLIDIVKKNKNYAYDETMDDADGSL